MAWKHYDFFSKHNNMKNLLLLLVILLTMQTFTSCDKNELEEQKLEITKLQADDYGGDDDIDNNTGDSH